VQCLGVATRLFVKLFVPFEYYFVYIQTKVMIMEDNILIRMSVSSIQGLVHYDL
jgi:hypothetical protein